MPQLACAETCTHAEVVQLIIELFSDEQCKRMPPEVEDTIHCFARRGLGWYFCYLEGWTGRALCNGDIESFLIVVIAKEREIGNFWRQSFLAKSILSIGCEGPVAGGWRMRAFRQSIW